MKDVIIPEHLLTAIIADMPEVRLNDDLSRVPYFGWGDKLELMKHMVLNAGSDTNIYPIIWLLLDEELHSDSGTLLTRQCDFIIATREVAFDLLNAQRYVKSFDVVLNPTTQLLIEGLRTSSVTNIVEDSWKIFKKPNYSETTQDREDNDKTQLPAIDLWDAVRLSCNVEFINNCLKPITWQTIKKT